jgi:hypothetical protein
MNDIGEPSVKRRSATLLLYRPRFRELFAEKAKQIGTMRLAVD